MRKRMLVAAIVTLTLTFGFGTATTLSSALRHTPALDDAYETLGCDAAGEFTNSLDCEFR
jgi:hypothetical protein